jgi:phage tail sheath gpL-like
MTIKFNNIPTNTRTPNVYAEVDNSRALKGLAANPHKVLILGQGVFTGNGKGTAAVEELKAITTDGLADGFFGPGSILARMCNVFKANNPNTELFAMALSANGGVPASATIEFSQALDGSAVSGTGTYYLMINGSKITMALTSGMSGQEMASAAKALIDANSNLPVRAEISAGQLNISAVCSGTLGNYIDIRHNYYDGEEFPATFSRSATIVSMADGSIDPTISDAWPIIDGEQYHYVVQPYIDATNLLALETEMADRFLPLEDLQGHAFTPLWCSDVASATTTGNSRNSPHNTIMAHPKVPNAPEEWAAALGAQASFNLNNDPARPLHFLKLKGMLPPTKEDRWTRAEREVLLTDGIATFLVDTGGNVLIERCITTFQANALGIPDVSYLDVQTLATLGEIRYQYKVRMSNRYIIPRFKLADDTFPVQAGSKVVTPLIIKAEIIGLFRELQDTGLIENLDDFIDNLQVERNATDRNRVDVLMPPDLINQFRVLAGLIQFIL